jgi:hypothetical protein
LYQLAFHQLPTHSLDNKTKGMGFLEPTCEHF